MILFSLRSFVLWIVLSLCASCLFAADWPRWLGPANDGLVPPNIAVPTTLPTEPKVVWRMKIGEGLASPVVASGKVFCVELRP